MPPPKPEGDAAPTPHYMALSSLPVPIPWLPDAYAIYDLARCVDLPGATYRDLTAPFAEDQKRILAAMEAFTDATPLAERKALETEFAASTNAMAMALLAYTRCQVVGVNPTPVADKPDTWAHLHPALRQWLAHQGRQAAADQLQSPLAGLRSSLSASR